MWREGWCCCCLAVCLVGIQDCLTVLNCVDIGVVVVVVLGGFVAVNSFWLRWLASCFRGLSFGPIVPAWTKWPGPRPGFRDIPRCKTRFRLTVGVEEMPEPDLLAEPLLDAREAAKLLHVPRSTLYELVRSRGLPHVRVGRTLRFTRQDLSAWITANTYGLQALNRD